MTGLRPLVGVATAALVLGGGYLLREATMSTHYETGPASRLHVVVDVSSNRAEPGHSLDDLTAAHLAVCTLEVDAQQEGPVRGVDGRTDRFAVTLRPALDSTDRKQFQGCLHDWVVDHHTLAVVSMTEEGVP